MHTKCSIEFERDHKAANRPILYIGEAHQPHRGHHALEDAGRHQRQERQDPYKVI